MQKCAVYKLQYRAIFYKYSFEYSKTFEKKTAILYSSENYHKTLLSYTLVYDNNFFRSNSTHILISFNTQDIYLLSSKEKSSQRKFHNPTLLMCIPLSIQSNGLIQNSTKAHVTAFVLYSIHLIKDTR